MQSILKNNLNLEEKNSTINLTDVEILKLIRKGHHEYKEIIIRRHCGVCYLISKRYFSKGIDTNDVYQEGLLGILGAIRNYKIKNDRNKTFKSFIYLCIERSIISLIKKEGRRKHEPYNKSKSVDKKHYANGTDATFEIKDLLESKNEYFNPEKKIFNDLNYKNLKNVLKEILTKNEYTSIIKRAEKESYEEIAAFLNTNIKAVDNSIQRARKKGREVLKNCSY